MKCSLSMVKTSIYLTVLNLAVGMSLRFSVTETSELTSFDPFQIQLYGLDPCAAQFHDLLRGISVRPETQFTLDGYHYEFEWKLN